MESHDCKCKANGAEKSRLREKFEELSIAGLLMLIELGLEVLLEHLFSK